MVEYPVSRGPCTDRFRCRDTADAGTDRNAARASLSSRRDLDQLRAYISKLPGEPLRDTVRLRLFAPIITAVYESIKFALQLLSL